ncbi:hypothetical protein Asppvi_011106 [Aspergillus pseudoviridinutans]|uniref:glutathione transferase n=1 Tax=Aspergillus pseudoviridinutans TaxID=1517512 RepID=A0A9P3BMP8_9EURO|nr:uncharacterized protein Asppvi_011106 [Aspergillus pseudoviridinutans]GIJ92130.1 hypothetical protein Asppvi_011106 [Aspergillus pseudoviridinutans]
MKPIKVYGGYFGPNPLKICIILSELGIPYVTELVDFSQLKTPEYESINPNGRLPTIYDPNTDLTLWESGAIILYLVETYDKERRLSFAPGSPEAHQACQWLFYQVSGQGPYYGQAVWFKQYHPEKVPSALTRYVNEIRRVSKVLDRWLENREWLVGDKLSYADLSFITWQNGARRALSDEGYDENEFPHMLSWLNRMNEREKVKELVEKQELLIQEKKKAAAKEAH